MMDKERTTQRISTEIIDLDHSEFVAQVLQGMDKQEFKLLFHPILCTQTQSIEVVETLVYWQHPTYGYICCNDFSRKIEMCSLCIPFGIHILRLFSETMSFMKKRIEKTLRFSITISIRQLISEGYVEYICKTLHMFNNSLKDILIVIPDHEAIENLDLVESVLTKLCEQGFSFALSKYETGFKTLECINRLPLSMIKIDQQFIPNKPLHDEFQVGSLFESIVGLCQCKNVTTIAHGIQDKTQATMIQCLGVDFMQGAIFHEPMSVSDLISLCSQCD
ncbi:hypothetical protein AOC36_09040 [Erysipelothrix larvae]|uniref:EAL domain-containing protein n=1 Tax=Erysipelothrix larvae TaxID=1514105 RepID=A0A109UHH6_9FIRM|nr:EAL domain-containing protein [Erysipelothrix larvae]AMC94128.1 hypothetical protein AOC36_09040 [Erysipelothrix larvae]